MERYVVGLDEATDTSQVGGKGAGLAALRRIDGVRVPPGFCVTTAAFAAGLTTAVEREVRAAVRPGVAYAVRSSATTEDAAGASAAGQHDSFLGVTGADAVLGRTRDVWASLDSEHATAYRAGRRAAMAVVVQELVDPVASGVLFTADPVSGNRRVSVVEATRGFGDALVAGRVDPDVLRVRDGVVVERRLTAAPALDEAQVLELVALGRRVEEHLGAPQDIEWCLDHAGFALVQSRPITTLFPVPRTDAPGLRVFMSVGHQQMMTDPMRPLGLSLFRLAALAVMHEAGGRLWVDATPALTSSRGPRFLGVVGRSDPLTGDALRTLIERGDVALGTAPDEEPAPPLIDADPELVARLVAEERASIAELRRRLEGAGGPGVVDRVIADLEDHKRVVFGPDVMPPITTAVEATWWLEDHLAAWLGAPDAAALLSRSVPGNVSSEMGLALLDVADVLRPHPEAVALLEAATDDAFLDALPGVPGGEEVRAALLGYLEAYGVRCAGEIDVTRPRWNERPSALLPMLLGNVRSFAPGEGRRRFAEGQRAAREAEAEYLARVRELPDGEAKAAETARMIARLRTFAGYREHPKFHIVARFALYKHALMAGAERLTEAGVLRAAEDAFWLTLPELAEVSRDGTADHGLIARRRAEFAAFAALTPPRVLTSEGEALLGEHRRGDVPAGALTGIAVSAGTAEGRARVVRDPGDAALEPGDILVTAFTDPSWSPLFVAAAGLVTEVGGVMTHGAVVAREYGLPAVVGVPGATRLIADGQRIRVHGGAGWVELLG